MEGGVLRELLKLKAERRERRVRWEAMEARNMQAKTRARRANPTKLSPRANATMVKFDLEGGWGFIREPQVATDLFVNRRNVESHLQQGHPGRDLYPGDRVTYTHHHGERGWYTLHVRRVEEEENAPLPSEADDPAGPSSELIGVSGDPSFSCFLPTPDDHVITGIEWKSAVSASSSVHGGSPALCIQISHLVILTAAELDPPFVDELQLIGEEHEFYTLVCAELDHFSQQGNRKAVLLFPPVSSRLRYLIHRLTEVYNTLTSFSVGEGWQRRTVICHASIRTPQENGESRTRSRDENRDRFWSSASPSRKWESGRGRQNWRQRKDRRPDKEPYAARGKHVARGRGEHWRGHVKDQGQMRAPEDGQCAHNGNGELLQSKKVSGEEMLEGQEEVHCETESQEAKKISGKMEDSACDRQDNLGICQKLHENKGKDRRPGQVEAADAAGGPSDLDMRQDYVAEERAGWLSVRSVDDQVVSEIRGIAKSQLEEEEAEMSSITRDLHEMKVVEQEDKEVRAEGLEENCRKDVAHEEAEMPVEPREEATIPLVGQEQAEIMVMVQEETEMRAVAHEKAELSAETREKVGMPAEPKEEATIPVVPQEQAETTEVVKDEKEMKEETMIPVVPEEQAEIVKGEKEMNMEVQEQASIGMEHRGVTECGAALPLVEADYELQSRSNMESEKYRCTEEESADNSVQESALTVQDDEQKMLEQLMVEIHANVCEKDVHIQPLQGDFSEFSEVQVDRGKYGHIIEVYGFSPELSAEDLMEPFKEYRDKGFCLELVDNAHALGIFSSPVEAFAASCQKHPAMKFRPLSQGSRQSKYRAYEKAAFKQPHKERPRTDTTVARRMVHQALALPKTPDQFVVE
ncbi:R3H and coiled-coil domain-containing protein 1 [Phyllobates terribilis]|uniref:R3H and coiled-coil domain-containing protein 1 n=1 Tax=Phyllobates terribilis TaxID=111132 RepID=UPI003CCB49A4